MSEPVTIIGINTVVNGNMEGDEDLTIEGRVEGTITLSRTLTIESNGVVQANINVRNAIISGVLVGNVEAEDSVHITEEGRVMGDISAPRVILVDGASFRGSIDMGDFDVERGDVYESRRAEPAVRAEAAPVEEAPARVRPPAAPKAAPRAAESKPEPRAKATPATPAKKAPAKKTTKKKAPTPKVRSVGKAKASRKKR